MSNRNGILLTSIANRLGVQDETTLKKATEYIRLFHCKGSVKSLNDQAKTTLCLDLASSNSGTGFDKETAIKLSGFKRSVYQNHLHTVEKLLELDKKLTVSELCVQLSCTNVKELAEEILLNYNNSNKGKHLDHPQYVAAAIHAACKIKCIKIPKMQLVTASHLKAAQWKELTNEFDKFVSVSGIVSPNKRKRDNSISKMITEIADEIEDKGMLNTKQMDEVEDYESWKKRILNEAYEAVKIGK